ncbi:MAG: hypothetical protein P4M10_01880 [Verrucomicrobiae bacterium]|nr:hypothetical protein [Verrucomicrobiae bacterium]
MPAPLELFRAANQPANGSSDRRRNWLTALLLLALAVLLYLPTLRDDFIYYDDVRILKIHPELYGAATLGGDLRAIFVTEFPREEPLLVRDVSWALDSRLFGFGNPFGYHLGNVVLHGGVVALLFVCLLQMTRRYTFALAISVAYLALAVHTEPVAWIMGRKDLLAAMFMLLALITQTQRLAARDFTAQCGWFAVTWLCFAAGLLSKINVLTFPLVLWLHALLLPYLNGQLAPDQPFRQGRALLRETALLVPTLALSGFVYVWYQRTLQQMGVLDRGYAAHGFAHLWNLLMVNPLGFWLYLRQIFLPYHLAVQYAWPSLKDPYPLWQILVALATVGGALAAGVWLFLRRKDLFFYFAAFFALMIPYLNLLFIGIWVADRYVYFSVFCVLALALSVAGVLWRRSSRFGRALLLLLGAGLLANNLYQSLAYEAAWRNGETLWQYHIALPDHSPRDYDNLAAYYYADFSDALARHDEPRAATALHKMKVVVQAGLSEFWPDQQQPPPTPTAFLFFLRSLIEQVEDKPEAALASLLTSDRLRPRFDSTNLNLARLYRKLADASAADAPRHAANLRAARDRFTLYLQLAFRNRPPPPTLRQEMADLEAACSALPATETSPPPKAP